ncbi:unnamed protein product [Ectocarpus sp. 6 AP-2014]
MLWALEEFYVIGTFVPIAPEVFFRPAMLKDARHAVKDGEGNVTGVRLMCPICKSNKFTMSKTTWAYMRAVHDVSGTNLFAQARKYGCFNPQCKTVQEGVVKSMKNREKCTPGDLPRVGDGEGGKRLITEEEMNNLRRGDLGGMASVLSGFLRGGVGFSTNTKE